MEQTKIITFNMLPMSIGVLPSSYVDSMSYYETLLWLINYLENTVIPTINNNSAVTTELQAKYIELKSYVEHYFDNLDVQEEINNKLDEMVADGTFEQIIEQYIQSSAVWCFDNVSSMKEATNFIDGSYARTLGYYTANDGGASLYKIRNIDESDTIDEMFIIKINDDLVAELVYDTTLNVKQIGAKGDGETDDYPFISASLSKVINTYLPSGNYLIDTSLYIDSYKNIYGDGESSKIIAGNDLYHLIYISMKNNVNIHDLFLTGNAKNRETSGNLSEEIYGISIDFSQNVVVDNVTFTDMGYTSDPVSGGNMLSLNTNEDTEDKQNTENCIISNCKFLDPEYRSSFGIRLYSAWDLETDRKYYVKNNKIINCYFTGLSYNGIEVGGTGTIYNVIENNMFENMKCIIALEADKGASYNHFTNNIVKNLETAPNQEQNSYAFKDGSSGVDNTQSIGNTWIGNSAYNIKQNVTGACGGFQLAGAKDTIISDLLIDGVTPYADNNYNSVGIYISNSINNNCENIQIDNSKIINVNNGNGIQILAQNAKDIIINNCDIHNTQYGIRTTTTTSLGVLIFTNNIIHNCSENGINLNNNTHAQIKNNYIYSCSNGIFVNNGATGSICNNTVNNVTNYAIRLNGDDTNFYVANNNMNKAYYMPDTNTLNSVINNNIGGLTYDIKYVKNVKYQDDIPTTGQHYKGDIIYNTSPSAGGYIGWVCVSNGTPGTWKGFGSIAS